MPASPKTDTAIKFTLDVKSGTNNFVLTITGKTGKYQLLDPAVSVDVIQTAFRVLANQWEAPNHTGFDFDIDAHGNVSGIYKTPPARRTP
jgi:hypothetical protein